ncbi:hypothetical protein [Nocardia sp. NPDC050710]|uniref:hypothetical protein n=1 Tax=Nocardia sp. NPDC050710 TaxID=3157220 RepID=UPI0033DA5626
MPLERKPTIKGSYGTASQTKTQSEAESAQNQTSKNEREPSPTPEPGGRLATVTTLSATNSPAGEGAAVDPDPDLGPQPDPEPAAEAKRTSSTTNQTRTEKSAQPKKPLRAEAQRLRDDQKVRAALEEAFTSARRYSGEWGSAPIRISEDVKARLADRRAIDAERFGADFAETHYMEAALSLVPEDVKTAVEWVDAYLNTLGLHTPDTKGTTGRLRKTTATRFKGISRDLRRKHGYGKTGHLQTAALIRLLDSLDRLDASYNPSEVDLDEA